MWHESDMGICDKRVYVHFIFMWTMKTLVFVNVDLSLFSKCVLNFCIPDISIKRLIFLTSSSSFVQIGTPDSLMKAAVCQRLSRDP